MSRFIEIDGSQYIKCAHIVTDEEITGVCKELGVEPATRDGLNGWCEEHPEARGRVRQVIRRVCNIPESAISVAF